MPRVMQEKFNGPFYWELEDQNTEGKLEGEGSPHWGLGKKKESIGDWVRNSYSMIKIELHSVHVPRTCVCVDLKETNEVILSSEFQDRITVIQCHTYGSLTFSMFIGSGGER